MRDLARSGLIISAFLGLVLFFLGCPAPSAPAPLPRRDRANGKTPAPPPYCTMYFCGCPYEAKFLPGGRYEATWLSPLGSSWEGTWVLKKCEEGYVIEITERMKDGSGEWLTFPIPVTPDLRRGRDTWEGRFLLET